jgi:hypothetical protein
MGYGLRALVLATSWLGTGCIFPEPEKFSEPQRTPPIIAMGDVVPPVHTLLQLGDVRVHNFVIPFRSGDAGEPVHAFFFLDYNTPAESSRGNVTLDPSTLDHERIFTPQLRFSDLICTEEEAGGDLQDVACCHQLSLHLVHDSSVDNSVFPPRPDEVRSRGDRAIAVWWVALEADGTSPPLLGRCPTPLD